MEVTEFGISSNSPASLNSMILHIACQKFAMWQSKSCEIFPNKSNCLERVITWLKKHSHGNWNICTIVLELGPFSLPNKRNKSQTDLNTNTHSFDQHLTEQLKTKSLLIIKILQCYHEYVYSPIKGPKGAFYWY